ncbi:MAG: carbohydrate-binding domain-containing protein [Myxococcota bacterium]|jgi:hypothetical protein|nr:carbohydrate-binding domain-containing protein [Myxococcota bacterium]
MRLGSHALRHHWGEHPSDAIQAETQLLASGGSFSIEAGGGSSASLATDASAKGLKAGSLVQISGGSFDLDCADDAIHSDDAIVIENGSFQLRTGDDAVHGEESLSILGGELEISTSYEGIESKELLIEGGQIRVLSSDDGVNGAGGVDGSGGPPGPPIQGDYWLHITGGRVVVNARGDGIDVNGSIEMSDGVVLVNGPTEAMNGPLDYDRSFNISGGTLIAVGSSNMAQAPSTSSTQNSILLRSNTTRQAGTLIHLRSANGTELFTFKPEKAFQSVVFSSPALVSGSYSLSFGGSHSGTEEDGLYSGGSYTPGTL